MMLDVTVEIVFYDDQNKLYFFPLDQLLQSMKEQKSFLYKISEEPVINSRLICSNMPWGQYYYHENTYIKQTN